MQLTDANLVYIYYWFAVHCLECYLLTKFRDQAFYLLWRIPLKGCTEERRVCAGSSDSLDSYYSQLGNYQYRELTAPIIEIVAFRFVSHRFLLSGDTYQDISSSASKC